MLPEPPDIDTISDKEIDREGRLIKVSACADRAAAGERRGRGSRVRGAGWARAADAPRWWAATAARRARRAPWRRGMSSAPARPGPRARHGAGRARAPTHPLLRKEDLPQAHLLPPLLGSAVGAHRAGLRLRSVQFHSARTLRGASGDAMLRGGAEPNQESSGSLLVRAYTPQTEVLHGVSKAT
ncbi:unnamed protein product, partial [Brenthis ino]